MEEKSLNLLLSGEEVEIKVRMPLYTQYKIYKSKVTAATVPMNAAAGGTLILDANKWLAEACCTTHKADELAQFVEEYFDLYDDMAELITGMIEDSQKKLKP